MTAKSKYYENAVKLNKQNTEISLSDKGYGKTHIAKVSIKKGAVVIKSFGSPLDHQTAHYSIQISNKKHILPRYWTGRFWNHSCAPNTYARTNRDGYVELVALRDLKVGEEVTYSYWMTEITWTAGASESSLSCMCGEGSCRQKIPSFSQLTPSEQKRVH
jgi:SET domain-containing protein